jgi:hypothetical protein
MGGHKKIPFLEAGEVVLLIGNVTIYISPKAPPKASYDIQKPHHGTLNSSSKA